MPTQLESQLMESRERFLAYIRSKIADPDFAEDVLQDALLKAVRAAPSIRDDQRVLGWFHAILNNAIVDAYRLRAKVANRNVPIEDLDFAAEPDDQDEATLCQCFLTLVPTLKPEYAELVSAELNEEPAEATLSRLGITPNNLKVRRHRARQALRTRLEETCRTCAEHGCLDCTCKTGGPF